MDFFRNLCNRRFPVDLDVAILPTMKMVEHEQPYDDLTSTSESDFSEDHDEDGFVLDGFYNHVQIDPDTIDVKILCPDDGGKTDATNIRERVQKKRAEASLVVSYLELCQERRTAKHSLRDIITRYPDPLGQGSVLEKASHLVVSFQNNDQQTFHIPFSLAEEHLDELFPAPVLGFFTWADESMLPMEIQLITDDGSQDLTKELRNFGWNKCKTGFDTFRSHAWTWLTHYTKEQNAILLIRCKMEDRYEAYYTIDIHTGEQSDWFMTA